MHYAINTQDVGAMYNNLRFDSFCIWIRIGIEIHGYHKGHYPKYAQSTIPPSHSARTAERGEEEKDNITTRNLARLRRKYPICVVGMIHTCIAAH